ncbi:MAG: hypothetical protein GX376_01270 [Firmicutes bacterium]|nr:hypothetical protein [Bacillota bacterium]
MMRKIGIILLLICLLVLPGCNSVNDESALNAGQPDRLELEDGVSVVTPDGDGDKEPMEIEEDPLDSPIPSEEEGGEQPIYLEKTEELLRLGPFNGILPQIEWSPEGKNLAISGYSDGFGIWVFDYTKDKVRQLLQIPPREDSDYINLQLLGWSPQGKDLYFALEGLQTSSPYAGLKGTYVGRIEVAKGVAQEVAWFADEGRGARSQLKLTHGSNLLVYSQGDVWQVNMSSGKKKILLEGVFPGNGPGQVFFSPTGRYMVHQHKDGGRNGLVLIDTKNRKSSLIISDRDYHFFPQWGPSDEKLAFLTGLRREDGYDLFVGEDGALPPATLIQVFNLQDKSLTSYRIPDRQVGGPMWSPDGKRLALLSARWKEEVLNSFGPDLRWEGLWEIETDTGRLQLLATLKGEWFSLGGWSPNSDDIYLYRYEADGSSSLQVVDRREKRIKYTIQEAIDEPILWYKGSLVIGKVLEDSKRGDLYTEIYLVDPGGRTSQLTHNGGWKNGFRCWADQLAYVRGDTTDLSYLLYVEIISLP